MTSDAERLAQLLLELRMNAETLGKSLGKNDGDTIRNVLKGKYGLSAKLARACCLGGKGPRVQIPASRRALNEGISISGPLSFFALSCNWKFFT